MGIKRLKLKPNVFDGNSHPFDSADKRRKLRILLDWYFLEGPEDTGLAGDLSLSADPEALLRSLLPHPALEVLQFGDVLAPATVIIGEPRSDNGIVIQSGHPDVGTESRISWRLLVDTRATQVKFYATSLLVLPPLALMWTYSSQVGVSY
ncbi:MAG: hypothetical protein ACR2KO_07280 [Geodermatophilaceae bacterium]